MVEGLANVVRLGPVNRADAVILRRGKNTVDQAAVQPSLVMDTEADGMARGIRDKFSAVVRAAIVIVAKGGMRVAPVYVGREPGGNACAEGRLDAAADGTAGVAEHASCAAGGKMRQLQVANVHVEDSKLGVQSVFYRLRLDPRLIAPGVFRAIGEGLLGLYLIEVGERRHDVAECVHDVVLHT